MADVEEECLDAFRRQDKQEAARLLTKVEHLKNVKDGDGRSLVHFAARNGWEDICQQLIEEYHLSATDEAIHRRRPLHLACFWGRVGVVNYLLTLHSVIQTINDECGWYNERSALDWACVNNHSSVVEVLLKLPSIRLPANHLLTDKLDILCMLSTKMEQSTEFPVNPRFPVFVIGNSGAGKTTLTTAMEKMDFYILRTSIDDGMVSEVKPQTAGICTTTRRSTSIYSPLHDLLPDTDVEVYDLAGHPEYYSSHSTMLESLCLESPAVFVLMVNLKNCERQLSREIFKWSNFIKVESRGISSRVIIVGSRKDLLSSELLSSKSTFVRDTAVEALGKQHFSAFVALDSRRLSSENLKPFLTLLTKNISELCVAIPGANKMSFSCHLLLAFLEQEVKVKAISLGSLQELALHCDALSPFSDTTLLASALSTLAEKGLILFLRNKIPLSSSCIIIKKAKLLNETNGTLFAPDSYKEHRPIASNTGIVPLCLLHQVFPHYGEVLVTMLTSLQFCRLVERALLANITTNLSPDTIATDELLYFPALVRVEHPSSLSISNGFGWCMYCTNRHQQLSQRCNDAILLATTYQHCLPFPTPPDIEHPNETLLRKLDRSCTVWKNGVHWVTEEGTKAMVQFTEENRCISLQVSFNQKRPSDSLELRSSVIDLIRLKQKKLCSSVEVHEYLVSPSELEHIPHRTFSQLTVFAMEDVARSIHKRKQSIFDFQRKESMSLKKLLDFDPYEVFPPAVLQGFFDSEPVPITFFAGMNPLNLSTDIPPDGPLESSHLKDIFDSVRDLQEWKKLGLYLGVPYPTLIKIEKDKNGVDDQKMDMLYYWVCHCTPSKWTLEVAVKKMGAKLQ